MNDDPERLDAPNQQVVRPDQSGPADQGSGAGKPARKASAGKPGPKPKDKDDDAESGEKGG